MTPGAEVTPGGSKYPRLTKQDGKQLFGDPNTSQSEQQQYDISGLSVIIDDSPVQASSLVEEPQRQTPG